MNKRCDVCGGAPDWMIYASYAYDYSKVHPLVARYPNPMKVLCSPCLPRGLSSEHCKFAAPDGYYLVGASLG
jgi:hypothetical protein